MLLSPLAHVEPAALASLGALAGLVALGAFHGLNPAMGWLFAVALGLQQRSAWAVTRALAFITIGHAASLVVVAGFLLLIGAFVPLDWVRILSGVTLLLSARTRCSATTAIHGGWNAGQLRRPHLLVVPHGHLPRRGADAGADNP